MYNNSYTKKSIVKTRTLDNNHYLCHLSLPQPHLESYHIKFLILPSSSTYLLLINILFFLLYNRYKMYPQELFLCLCFCYNLPVSSMTPQKKLCQSPVLDKSLPSESFTSENAVLFIQVLSLSHLHYIVFSYIN